MSIVLTRNSNDSTQSGYFRIGHVLLDIPPTDILVHRVANNDRFTPIRSAGEMFVKSGQSRWDCVVSWTSMINEASDNPLQAWEDLQTVVAIFHAAPFVEIESPFLRQFFAEQSTTMQNERMAFGLRQLKIDSHSDIVDALKCTLTMTLFNYKPYSLDFAYLGPNGEPTSADKSPRFALYIDTWKQENLNTPKLRDPRDPAMRPWQEQENGRLSLGWRRYLPLSDGQPLPTTPVPLAISSVPKAFRGELPADIAALIEKIAGDRKFPVALAKAMALQESGGKATARSNKGAVGVMQLEPATAATYGVTDRTDPNQSINGGIRYMQELYHQYGSWDLSLAAYNSGPVNVSGGGHNGKGVYIPKHPARIPDIPETQQYVSNIMYNARVKYGMSATAPVPQSKTAAANTTATPATPPVPADSTELTEAQLKTYTDAGWNFDHRVDGVSFLFADESMSLDTIDFGINGYGLYPTQLSVVFNNNLAQVPLAGYQYPTYQHLGPAGATIGLSFTSVGDTIDDSGNEPFHVGVSTLNQVSHFLENQYLQLRTSFRRVASIQRMQAVFVTNKVLNLLGIHGLMPDQMTTETIPEASNMLSVMLTAARYENIFEDVGPYRTNGISGSYRTEMGKIMSEGISVPPSEAAPFAALLEFQQARSKGSAKALAVYVRDHLNPSGQMAVLAKLPAMTITATDTEKKALRNAIESSPTPLAGKRTVTVNFPGYSGFPQHVENVVAGKEVLNAGDALILNGYFFGQVDEIALQTLRPKLAIKDDPQALQPAYDAAFDGLMLSDKSIAAGVQQLVESPKYGARFKNAQPGTDPGKSTYNQRHGAYRDMGLLTQSLGGQDFNPGYYFYDHKADYQSKIKAQLPGVLATSINTGSNVNAKTGDVAVVQTSIPTDLNQMMQMTTLPGYNMAEAFPTFKLFFIEEDNLGVFYSFDNFYSYSSVLDIEVIRYHDKPSVAKIKLSNLSNLLSHKLFDDTSDGRRERMLDRFARNIPQADDNGAVASPVSGDAIAGKTLGGAPYQLASKGYDYREGYPTQDGVRRRIPLRYVPLQTGTKVQLRFGYTNNPDALVPVITGLVTEIEGEEILTITLQSYMLELLGEGTEDRPTNTYWQLGAALENGAKVISLGLLGDRAAGPAFGGFSPFGDSGDAAPVMESLLRSANAKHFGHWQIGAEDRSTINENMVKGFTWKKLAPLVAGAISPAAKALLSGQYDRSGENIMVNHVINFDGNQLDNTNGRRRYDDEYGDTWFQRSAYYIEEDCPMTTWELMRDVARRYPEYILCEKQYGFPFGAEATIVFGHPLDWYYSRWPMLGDTESLRAADSDQHRFKEWWTQQGKNLFQEAMRQVMQQSNLLSITNLDSVTAQAGQGPSQMADQIANMLFRQRALFGLGPSNKDDLIPAAFQDAIVTFVPNLLNTIMPLEQAKLQQAQRELNEVQKSYEMYVRQSGALPSDYLKPIRRYHFVDHQSIVHNGMKLNEKIHNAVKLGDHGFKANKNIPDQHIRVLDVTALVNNPKKNVLDPGGGLVNAYCQSFLKDELGEAYQGDIVLRGIPAIEPFDVLVLLDPSTGIVGNVEVKTVIHSFNQDEGFITIVKPRMIVAVNEVSSASLARSWQEVYLRGSDDFWGITRSKAALGTAVAAEATVAASVYAGVTIFGGPPVWLAELMILTGLVIASNWFRNQIEEQNPLLIYPVTRLGRPWFGGLQGWEIADYGRQIEKSWEQFWTNEISPTLDLYKILIGAKDDYVPES